MSDEGKSNTADKLATNRGVIRFPQSRTEPPGANRPARYLGLGPMAKLIGAPEEQATGHWCSRCQGIWFGYLLEVTCPVCGNRQG